MSGHMEFMMILHYKIIQWKHLCSMYCIYAVDSTVNDIRMISNVSDLIHLMWKTKQEVIPIRDEKRSDREIKGCIFINYKMHIQHRS